MIEFKLTEEEKKDIRKEAHIEVIQNQGEYTGYIHNRSSLAEVIEIADEMLKLHPTLTYKDLEMSSWEEPVDWEDYTEIVSYLSCPSTTKEAYEQRCVELEKRALCSKRLRYEKYLELKKEFE